MNIKCLFPILTFLLLLFSVPSNAVHKDAPVFKLQRLDGVETGLEDYQGKVILLNFWATWCFPCRQEMPGMETLWQRYHDAGLVVIGITNDEADKRNRVETYVKKVNLSFPILLDPDSLVNDLYQVSGIPATYLINKQGEIVEIILGGRDWASKESFEQIERLLQ